LSAQTDILLNPGCRYCRGLVVGLDHPGFFMPSETRALESFMGQIWTISAR
jgi:hypothetical protein